MKLVIGYDGSKYSDDAINDLKLAGLPHDSKVLIASVGDLLMSAPDLSEAISQAVQVPPSPRRSISCRTLALK